VLGRLGRDQVHATGLVANGAALSGIAVSAVFGVALGRRARNRRMRTFGCCVSLHVCVTACRHSSLSLSLSLSPSHTTSYATIASNRAAPHHILQASCLEAGEQTRCARACIAASVRVQAAALWSLLPTAARQFPVDDSELRRSLFALVRAVSVFLCCFVCVLCVV
jgi:hypothetical protein